MQAVIRAGIVCVVVALASRAGADPRAEVGAKYRLANQLAGGGAGEEALAVIEEGLAIAPKDLPLLGLKGRVLLSLYDYAGALATYQAYLDAGARGANRREADKIIHKLQAVQSTALEVTVANGPAAIYLESATHRPVCEAAPCKRAMLPGQYRVIAERRGFERWTGQVTVVNGETARLAISLIEKPSLLTVRVAQPGARITVDDAAYSAPATVAAGVHRVAVALAGHVTARLEAAAHEGKPVELEVALAPLVPVQLSPAGARLLLDGKPIALDDGGLAVPPGAHVLVAGAQGFRDGRVEIPAARGDDYRIAVELVRDAPAPVAAAPSGLSLRRKVAIASGGVGVAAIATGVILGLQSRQLDHDTYALCPSPSEPCGAALRANDLNRQAHSRALAADVAFGVAGGAAITAAVLWFTGASESRLAVTPRLGSRTHGVGLDLAMRF